MLVNDYFAGDAYSRIPNASVTFIIVENSGFPDCDSAL